MALNKRKGVLAKISSFQQMAEKPRKFPREATVTMADNGGYSVRVSGGNIDAFPGELKVYEDMEGVFHCLEDHFGKGKKKDEKY